MVQRKGLAAHPATEARPVTPSVDLRAARSSVNTHG